MLRRLRHRTPLPTGTKITLSDRSYIIEKLLDCGGSSLLYEVHPMQPHHLPLILKERYPSEGYLRQEDGLIRPIEDTEAEKLLRWHQQIQAQETELSQLAARHNFQVIPVREQVTQAVITLPNQPAHVISNYYTLMDDRSAQGVVLSAYSDTLISLPEAVAILKTVLSAYAALHRDGFLHGDCSMGNIMLLGGDTAHGNVGTAHLLDFGCTCGLMEDGFTEPVSGPIYSTDGYCAPELLYALPGSRLTAACDVWSLGFLLLELLTKISRKLTGLSITEHLIGSFRARQITGTMAKQLQCDTATLHCVNAILERALEENPERRYPNAGAMLEDVLALERCLSFNLSGPVDRWLLWHAALRFRQREPHPFLTGHITMGTDSSPLTIPMQAQLEEGPLEPALPLLKKLVRAGESIYLHAPGGGGKSILAAQLMAEGLSSGEWIPLYLELSGLHPCADGASLRQQILHALAVQYFGRQEPNTVQQIAQWMAAPSQSPGCLLVLNDLHKLSPAGQTVLRELLQSSALGQNTVVLVTGRTEDFSLRRVKLAPLSHQQICDIIQGVDFRSEDFLPLYQLLSLPLFLMRYLELIRHRNSGDIPVITTPSELLLLYFGEREYHAQDSSIHQTLTVHLPFVAYQWMRSNQPEVSQAQIGDWLKEEMGWLYTPERLEEFLQHCTGPLCVLYPASNGTFRFSHDYNQDYFAASFIAQQLQQALSRQDTYPLRSVNHPWTGFEDEDRDDLQNMIAAHSIMIEHSTYPTHPVSQDFRFTYLVAVMAMELCPLRLDHGVIQRLYSHNEVFLKLYDLLTQHPGAKTDAYHIPYTLYHTFEPDPLRPIHRPADAAIHLFLELAGQWGNLSARLTLIQHYWNIQDWNCAIFWWKRLMTEVNPLDLKSFSLLKQKSFCQVIQKIGIAYWFGLGDLTPDREYTKGLLKLMRIFKSPLQCAASLYELGQHVEFYESEEGSFVKQALCCYGPYCYSMEHIFEFQDKNYADFAALCYQMAAEYAEDSAKTSIMCSFFSLNEKLEVRWKHSLHQNRDAAYAIIKGDLLWQNEDTNSALWEYQRACQLNGRYTRLLALQRLIRCNEELGNTDEAERWREEITPSDRDTELFQRYM